MIYSSIDDCIEHLRLTHDIVIEIKCDYDSIESAKVDLYVKLSQARQDAFDDNQRLILILDRDFYSESSDIGAILQAIQIIIQDIDISNFFVCIVTTNPRIESEYQQVNHNFSHDSVPFHVYQCIGNFEKIISDHTPMHGKMQSLKHIADTIQDLSPQQKNLLFVDEVFCIMPWIGLNIEPDSTVRPCCEFEYTSMGNLRTQTIKDIWNSDKMKQIRKSMLSNKSVKGCQSCYHKETLKRDSLRKSINRDFAHHIGLVDQTDYDGSLSDLSIKFWDVRYNNLCNLSCRSCNPTASSSWYQIHNSLYPEKKLQIPLLTAGNDSDELFGQIVENIDQVEKIYFAGGEPMMIENFYTILELLIERGRTDVHLCYNTNLTRLSLKDKSILDLWSKFPKVSVGASLDGEKLRAEYLRTGTKWNQILKNRIKIRESCPHVDFYVSATTGLLNALHVPEFHRSWVDQGFINVDDFNVQLLYKPDYMNITNAPDLLKEKIVITYKEHLEWLKSKDTSGRATSGFQSIIDLCSKSGKYDPAVFWSQIDLLDQYHGTNLFDTFPELIDVGLERP